ncbi:hypothetical protein HDU93_003861 [Gonapodya sp. JEL0774]|nr:hypothetical protein HDU93_003861 [Gonapodya sp. JEL0774]
MYICTPIETTAPAEAPSSRYPATLLSDLGATVVEISAPEDTVTLQIPLRGCSTLVLVLGDPGSDQALPEGVAEWARQWIEAAGRERVERVFLVTVCDEPNFSGNEGAEGSSGGFIPLFHLAEQHLLQSLPPPQSVIVRVSPPGIFFDSLALFAQSVAEEGVLRMPVDGECEIPLVDLPDLTRLLLRLIIAPPSELKPAYTFRPPVCTTGTHIATVLSNYLSKPVRFENLPESGQIAGGAGTVRDVSPLLADQLALLRSQRVQVEKADPDVRGDLFQVTGETGRTVEEWVRENIGVFKERERREEEMMGPDSPIKGTAEGKEHHFFTPGEERVRQMISEGLKGSAKGRPEGLGMAGLAV